MIPAILEFATSNLVRRLVRALGLQKKLDWQ
jgi:hypothetical protein